MNPISPTSRYSSPPSPATSNTQRLGQFVRNCPPKHYWPFVDLLQKMASTEGKMLLDKIENSGNRHLKFETQGDFNQILILVTKGDSANRTMRMIEAFVTRGELLKYFEKMNHDFNAIFGIES
jgi:hypothetical protein